MRIADSTPAATAQAQLGLDGTWRLFVAVGLVSIFTNLLMLTGPLFMLQVYDRVLSSQSEATLVVLFGLVAFLYLIFGVLDHARARIAARAGAQYQLRLDGPVFRAALSGAVARGGRRGTCQCALHRTWLCYSKSPPALYSWRCSIFRGCRCLSA